MSRDTFVGFWKYDVIVSSVGVPSRVPGFKEKSLMVISCETNDLDVFKVHVVVKMWTWLVTLEFWSNPATASALFFSFLNRSKTKLQLTMGGL